MLILILSTNYTSHILKMLLFAWIKYSISLIISHNVGKKKFLKVKKKFFLPGNLCSRKVLYKKKDIGVKYNTVATPKCIYLVFETSHENKFELKFKLEGLKL